MDKWEFMSVTVEWDSSAEQCKVTTPSGEYLRGKNIGEALNPEGEQGWELVSLFLNQWSPSNIPMYYRAVFKRRKP